MRTGGRRPRWSCPDEEWGALEKRVRRRSTSQAWSCGAGSFWSVRRMRRTDVAARLDTACGDRWWARLVEHRIAGLGGMQRSGAPAAAALGCRRLPRTTAAFRPGAVRRAAPPGAVLPPTAAADRRRRRRCCTVSAPRRRPSPSRCPRHRPVRGVGARPYGLRLPVAPLTAASAASLTAAPRR